MNTNVKQARTWRVGRRGFLGTLGAGGIAAAVGLFGRSEPAYGICVKNCCHLANCPNISYSACAASADYIWACTVEGGLICNCCEAAGYSKSAFTCSY
ncbi:MAG TPA: twin-arginine translocation signal domain-containing protein [Streptosporangiaceae bacterium]|jgi:hypothetical protein